MKIKNDNIVKIFKDYYYRNGYRWNEEINIIGVRDTHSVEKEVFNDIILLIHNETDIYLYKGTTDPGKPFTLNPLNNKGCAHLKDGFWKDIWKVGRHRNKYTALVQVNPVTVWRDRNKNFINDEGIEDTGYFGINLHKTGFFRNFIGKGSAGCQVFKDPKDFEEVMDIILSSDKYTENINSYFSYLLLDINKTTSNSSGIFLNLNYLLDLLY